MSGRSVVRRTVGEGTPTDGGFCCHRNSFLREETVNDRFPWNHGPSVKVLQRKQTFKSHFFFFFYFFLRNISYFIYTKRFCVLVYFTRSLPHDWVLVGQSTSRLPPTYEGYVLDITKIKFTSFRFPRPLLTNKRQCQYSLVSVVCPFFWLTKTRHLYVIGSTYTTQVVDSPINVTYVYLAIQYVVINHRH